MKLVSLVFGLFFVGVGCVAIFDGDLWDSWQWLLAAAVGVMGLGGLASALAQSRPAGDSQHQRRSAR